MIEVIYSIATEKWVVAPLIMYVKGWAGKIEQIAKQSFKTLSKEFLKGECSKTSCKGKATRKGKLWIEPPIIRIPRPLSSRCKQISELSLKKCVQLSLAGMKEIIHSLLMTNSLNRSSKHVEESILSFS